MDAPRKIEYTRCCYCRRHFSDTVDGLEKTKDHFIPKSRTGSGLENKLDSCFDCNNWKADKMPDAWLNEVKKYKKKGIIRKSYTIDNYSVIISNIKRLLVNFKRKIVSDYKV